MNNCLLSLKRTSRANFNTHQVLIRIPSASLGHAALERDNASYGAFIVVIQRNPPKGRRHFIGQTEPGLHLCLACLYTRSLTLIAVADRWGSHGELSRYAWGTVAKNEATFLNFKVSTKPWVAWRNCTVCPLFQHRGWGPLKEAWSEQIKGSALPALNSRSINLLLRGGWEFFLRIQKFWLDSGRERTSAWEKDPSWVTK